MEVPSALIEVYRQHAGKAVISLSKKFDRLLDESKKLQTWSPPCSEGSQCLSVPPPLSDHSPPWLPPSESHSALRAPLSVRLYSQCPPPSEQGKSQCPPALTWERPQCSETGCPQRACSLSACGTSEQSFHRRLGGGRRGQRRRGRVRWCRRWSFNLPWL